MSGELLKAWQGTVTRRAALRAVQQSGDGRVATFLGLETLARQWREKYCDAIGSLKGKAVVFAEPNRIRWLEIFIGLLQAGAIVVPLDPAEPGESRKRIAHALRAAYWWDGSGLRPLPRAKRYHNPAVSLIKLTSGTTGLPRALVFTDKELLADARHVTSSMGITGDDLNYALIPFGHSYGLGNLVVPLLAQGVPVVCGQTALPHAIEADFEHWRPTVFPGVPAIWRGLAGSDVKLRGLRLAISAGAPLPPETAREFAARHGRRIHGFYGSSETGGIAFDSDGAATLSGGVGRALRGVKLRFLPRQRLWVESAAIITHGNRRRGKKHGAWIMPDRVEHNPQSGLILLGRRGAMVKIAGRRLNLAEVAARLRQLPGVKDAWVGVKPGPDVVLGAVLVTAQGVPEIRAALQVDTASWKIPKRMVTLPALPLTGRGKTDARALEALLFSDSSREAQPDKAKPQSRR